MESTNMKKRIIIDMDGVLADVYPALIANEPIYANTLISSDKLNGIAEYEAFPHLKEIVTHDHFFRNLPEMDNAFNGLKYLNEKYEVLIVSAALEFANSMNDKLAWLNDHFPFINWRQVLFCGRKDMINADIIIDDHPKNLSVFNGQRFIFTQPHNTNFTDPSYHRINNWNEITQVL